MAPPAPKASIRAWLWIASALALTIPGLALRFAAFSEEPGVQAALFGVAILGAAFLLAWGTEVAQLDVARSLALAALALVAVLPEYGVDLAFAWRAADDPTFTHYAAANMTGANRLLIGIGWPLVILLFWFKHRKPSVRLESRQSIELTFLLLATVWAFTIFLRSFFFRDSLTLLDTVVLAGLFALYLVASSRGKRGEVQHLAGPAAAIAALGKTRRRAAALALFLFPAFVILLSAEPFAESLVKSGEEAGIDEFLLVQWLAPLASEAPEFSIAILFSLRGMGSMAMGTLLSSSVNQWSLLVGTLPLVYSINLGSVAGLPLDTRQLNEILLTSSHALFAVILLAALSISWRWAILLLILFVTHLFFTDPQVRAIYALVYLGLGVAILTLNGERRRGAWGLIPRALKELRSGGAAPHTPDM